MRQPAISLKASAPPIVKAIGIVILAGLLSASALAQDREPPVNLRDPLPNVALRDGRILHNVRIVGFGNTTVVARWEGGRGTIAYDQLPDEIRKAAELSKPVQPPEEVDRTRAEGKPADQAPFALTAARRGFTTRLLRPESAGEPPEQPPPGVLELVPYQGPLGPMAAYLGPSPHDGRRHPAIIWIVGGRSNSISPIAWTPGPPENDQSATGFREAGIIMMYPSLRGGNDSPGRRERFFGEVDDVIAAGRFLARLSYVDPRRIYLGGHSTGGTLALLVAESSDQFRAVYSLGPVADMTGYTQDDVPFDLSNPKEGQLRSPKLWLDSIRVPTFVYEGTESPCNSGALRTMAEMNRNPLVKFTPVPGGTHFTIIAQLVRDIAQQILKDDVK